MHIRPFQFADETAVVELWRACELVVPWNDPHRDIARKMAFQPELFLVGEHGGQIVATAMAGYEGHRGWLNYVAVSPQLRRLGLGRQIVEAAVAELAALGCPKINLQVRATNSQVVAFYESLGFSVDAALSLGRRLVDDEK